MKTKPTRQMIAKIVADYYGVSVMDLISHRRPGDLSWARWCAINLVAEETSFGVETIADWFDRTPEAINNALRKLKEELEWNAPRRRQYTELRERLLSIDK